MVDMERNPVVGILQVSSISSKYKWQKDNENIYLKQYKNNRIYAYYNMPTTSRDLNPDRCSITIFWL